MSDLDHIEIVRNRDQGNRIAKVDAVVDGERTALPAVTGVSYMQNFTTNPVGSVTLGFLGMRVRFLDLNGEEIEQRYKEPKPLNQLSEEEIDEHVKAWTRDRKAEEFESREGLIERAVEEWDLKRCGSETFYGRQGTSEYSFPVLTQPPTLTPVVNYRTITVKLPGWLLEREARLLARLQIEEQWPIEL